MPNVPNPACGVIQAARMLGLSRAAIRHRMSRYGITRPQVAPHPGLPGVEDGAGSLRAEALSLESTQEPSRVSAASWEQKPVAVLAIELTWPAIGGGDASPYEPWTAARRWERIILEKVHGFGGVCLQRSPSLLLVAFGLPQTVEQLPQRAVQAALAVRQLLGQATRPDGKESRPVVRLAVHLGQALVGSGTHEPMAHLHPIGEVLALPVRLLGQAAPGGSWCRRRWGGSSAAGLRWNRGRGTRGIDRRTRAERLPSSACGRSVPRWRWMGSVP